jgi:FkbM family methyltransferase
LILNRFLRPGDTFLDIGAQYGLYTLQAAGMVGPSGVVHAFEPQPRSADLLESSLLLNGMDNVHLHRHALGNEDTRAIMTIPGHNAGAGSLVHQHETGIELEVEVRNASSALLATGMDRVRLVKIDVEGFESEVIAGARDWIRKVQPDALIIETASSSPLAQLPFYSDLTESGYLFVQIDRRPFGLSLGRVDPNAPLEAFDVIAVRDKTILNQIIEEHES